MTGRIVSTHLTGRFFVYSWQVLGRTFGTRLEAFGFYLNVTKQAGFRSRSCGIGRLAKFLGIPIMRTKLATTAFKMPLYGIGFPLSAYPVSSTVFQNTEKLSCANEVSASKQSKQSKQLLFNKCLLLPDRSLSGHKFHFFSDFQGTDFLCLENLYQSNFTAAKSSNGLSRLFFMRKNEE